MNINDLEAPVAAFYNQVSDRSPTYILLDERRFRALSAAYFPEGTDVTDVVELRISRVFLKAAGPDGVAILPVATPNAFLEVV